MVVVVQVDKTRQRKRERIVLRKSERVVVITQVEKTPRDMLSYRVIDHRHTHTERERPNTHRHTQRGREITQRERPEREREREGGRRETETETESSCTG